MIRLARCLRSCAPACWPAVAAIYGVIVLSTAALPARAESGQDYARQAGARLVGQSVELPRLTTVDGATLDLAALRGRKAVYLKFWATWCVPCREQMPHFERVMRGSGNDLQVIGVNIGFDDTVEQLKAYRLEHGLTMPLVRDDDGRLAGMFGLRVTPQHVVIGKDGRIQYIGHLADARLDAALASARSPSPGTGPPPARGSHPPAAVLRIGDTVHVTDLRTLDGDRITLKDPLGTRQSVLAFFSPWCEEYFRQTRPQSSAECARLRSRLMALRKDDGVRWLAIASGLWASEQDVREYRDEHQIAVPLVLDRDGSLFRRFGVQRVPALIVVDARGRIVRHAGIGEYEAATTHP